MEGVSPPSFCGDSPSELPKLEAVARATRETMLRVVAETVHKASQIPVDGLARPAWLRMAIRPSSENARFNERAASTRFRICAANGRVCKSCRPNQKEI